MFSPFYPFGDGHASDARNRDQLHDQPAPQPAGAAGKAPEPGGGFQAEADRAVVVASPEASLPEASLEEPTATVAVSPVTAANVTMRSQRRIRVSSPGLTLAGILLL